MEKIDMDLLNNVLGDLNYLFKEWTKEIDDDSLRITSTILRRLLIDSNLSKSTRIDKRKIEIITPMICHIDGQRDFKNVEFYQCGGAKHKGAMIQSISIIPRVMSEEEISKKYQNEKDILNKNHPVKISAFLKQISFVIKGIKINREEVIKYVCHKLGGAHYDNERKSKKDVNDISLDHKYALMDSVHNSIKITEKNAIYYELLSIGRMIINSPDINKLRKDIPRLISHFKNIQIQMIQNDILRSKYGIPKNPEQQSKPAKPEA
jgi:hypothetical protein